MKGMLMQLAAATAANGTNRLTIGGRRCKDGLELETQFFENWCNFFVQLCYENQRVCVHVFISTCITEARDLSPRAVTTAPVVALT